MFKKETYHYIEEVGKGFGHFHIIKINRFYLFKLFIEFPVIIETFDDLLSAEEAYSKIMVNDIKRFV
jgi:hypothetical protein